MKRCAGCGHLYDQPGWCCPVCNHQAPRLGSFTALAPEIDSQGEGYDARFYPELAALEAGNFWFLARNRLILWVLRSYCGKPPRILEVGCGTGFVLAMLSDAYPEAELMGGEVFSAGLHFAATRAPDAELVQMDARALPFVAHFDLVGVFDVLEHIAEDEQVLTQIHQTLRPGGALVLTVPQHQWLWSATDDAARHMRRYSAAEIRRKVATAGFDLVYESSFVTLLLPLMGLSRLFGRRAAPSDGYDPLAELRTGRTGNALLGLVMTIERGLIRVGVHFPFGGSRLLVARRGGPG